MREILIIILLLLAGNAGATDIVIHVWEDTTGILGDTDCVVGDCYLTLQAAETAEQKDLDAANDNIVFVIKGSWTGDDVACTFDGWVTSATDTIAIITVGDARHAGTYSSTAYRIEESGGANRCFNIQDDYVTVDGIQGINTGSAQIGILSQNISYSTIINNIMVGAGEGGAAATGIHITGGTGSVAYNNIVYDWGTRGIYSATTSGRSTLYHNTIVDCAIGIDGGYQNNDAANNIIYSCATPITTTGIFYTVTNTATDAGSLSYGDCGGGGCGTDDVLSISDPFVNRAGDNYLLAASTAPVDAGIDVTGTVPNDIIGTSKPVGSDSDIGANERLAAAGDDLSYVRRIKEGEGK